MTDTARAERNRRMEPVSPAVEELGEVERLSAMLDGLAGRMEDRGERCKLLGPRGEEVELPASVFHVLERAAGLMAQGDAVTVVPVGQELTTRQAADLLNVSRQYLVRLLDEGRIAFTRAGSHRRILAKDVLAFNKTRRVERRNALDRLAALSEENGGYPELD